MDYSNLGNKRNKRKQNPHTTRMRNKFGLLVLRITLGIILVATFAGFGAVAGFYLAVIDASPDLDHGLVITGYQSSVIVCAHTGEELLRIHGGQHHERVTFDQIPDHVVNAFIAIEDERFWEHNGIDIRGIGRAATRLVQSGGARTEGASTITQQLIKNMLGHFDSDFITKLQEQYLAVNFERDLTEQLGSRRLAKEFILESYLNIINLGRSNQGVQAAALFYYDVNVWELSIAQAATIAAIAQNPSRFPPDTRPEENWGRAVLVLEAMLRQELITEEEFYEAMNSNVYDTIFRMEGGATRPIISPFDCFTNALIRDLINDIMYVHGLSQDMATRLVYSGGLRIYSTQNQEMQAIVDRVFLDQTYWPDSDFTIDIELNLSILNSFTGLTRHYRIDRTVNNMEEAEAEIESLIAARMTEQDEIVRQNVFFTPQPQAAFVLLDHHTGHVLAMRGVRGETGANRTLNRATQSTRSPGSQMKPIATFGPAFDLGIMQPSTVIDDVPFTHIDPWGGADWTPGNWWASSLGFEGLSTARRAVYRSMNVVSVRATIDTTIPHVGVDTMFDYLRRMGISTLVEGSDAGAVTLGGMTHGVRLIELAGAYGMVANGGQFNRPVLYTLVLGPTGDIVLENPHAPVQVLRDTAAYLLLDTMRDTMRMTGATGHQINWVGEGSQQMRQDIPVAGKTGTSQDNRDIGFSGSTPYLTASIWMGNDNNRRMSSGVSGYHLRAWRTIMQEIHQDLPARSFERPARIVGGVAICLDSGMLATDLCRQDPHGNRARNEIFDARFVPVHECTVHRLVTYCSVHGHAAGIHCPPDALVTRVGLVRPTPLPDTNIHVQDRWREVPRLVLEGVVCDYHQPQHNQPEEDPFDFWDYWWRQQAQNQQANQDANNVGF